MHFHAVLSLVGPTQSRLTCFEAMGPPSWWGPYHPYDPRGGGP